MHHQPITAAASGWFYAPSESVAVVREPRRARYRVSDTPIPEGAVAVTVYGTQVLFRGWCRRCKKNAFIQAHHTACCDEPFQADRVIQARMAESVDKRRPLSQSRRQRLIDRQGGICFYCERPFWSEVYRRGKAIMLVPNADHLVPYAYLQSNPFENYVAACRICNGIKSSIVFLDVQTARDYIRRRWSQRGYTDVQIGRQSPWPE